VHVSLLSDKVHAERSKNPPVMIEGKTTEQAVQKIRCIVNKKVSSLIHLNDLLLISSLSNNLIFSIVIFECN